MTKYEHERERLLAAVQNRKTQVCDSKPAIEEQPNQISDQTDIISQLGRMIQFYPNMEIKGHRIHRGTITSCLMPDFRQAILWILAMCVLLFTVKWTSHKP